MLRETYQGFVAVERVTALSGVDEPRLLAQAFDAQHALRECYEADMTTAGMYASKLAFRLVFQWDGALLSAERDPTSPIGPGPMIDCMAKALNRLIVPPHGDLGRAILVLALQPR